MEEDEYKATYLEIAGNRCVFEKTLTNNQGKCRFSRHFCLADREGYACESDEFASNCRDLLEKLRDKSRFSLKLPSVGAQLPHNMDIRVQVGGLRGLRTALGAASSDDPVEDIRALLERAETRYGNMDALPYSEIIQSITRFQGRSRRKKDSKQD